MIRIAPTVTHTFRSYCSSYLLRRALPNSQAVGRHWLPVTIARGRTRFE